MSATACALLRHDVRPRWIGALLAAWCHTCQPGHLFIPSPTVTAPRELRDRRALRGASADSRRSQAALPAVSRA